MCQQWTGGAVIVVRMHQLIGHITSARHRKGARLHFFFICLLFTVAQLVPSSGFQLQLTPALMFCCWICCPFDQVLAKWRQRWIQVTTKFRRMSFGTYYRPSSSKVGRLSEDFAEHPYEVPRIKKLEVRGASTQSGCKCFANSASSVNFFIRVLMSADCYVFFIRLTFVCHCCCCYCLQGCLCKLQRLKHIVIGKASRKDCVTNLPLR